MHLKIKQRTAAERGRVNTVKPLVLHDVTNQNASAVAASRRRMTANQAAVGAANHARHHVSRQTQS